TLAAGWVSGFFVREVVLKRPFVFFAPRVRFIKGGWRGRSTKLEYLILNHRFRRREINHRFRRREILKFPQRSSLPARRGVLSFRFRATGDTGSETARIHHAARCGHNPRGHRE